MKKLFIILSVISLSTFKIALSNGVGPFLPIKHAVSRGDLDAVHRALMLPYSHINEKGVDGTTPLHEAFDNYIRHVKARNQIMTNVYIDIIRLLGAHDPKALPLEIIHSAEIGQDDKDTITGLFDIG